MKTRKYFTSAAFLALVLASISFNCFAATDAVNTHNASDNSSSPNHTALARQYENLANEMLAKAQEQKAIIEHKPRTSFLGKNGQHIKSHIAYKIRQFEQAAQENLEKAAYHKTMATDPAQSGNQINKAKMKSGNATGL